MNTIPFTDLGISTQILNAVNEMGFEMPTKIQSAAIPKILEGRDVMGQAQTGTGKTAAFAIPILDRIDSGSRDVQTLVLCPTRELAIQVTGEFIKLASQKEGIHITPVYGGQPIQRQIKQLKKGTQIVVGTPGRVIDHLKRGTLQLKNLKMAVLDEADEMLNMGFREDIETILGYSSREEKVQMIMFSATMSPSIKKIMQRWFQDPEKIKIDGEVTVAEGVEHFIVEVRDSMRVEAISRILDINDYKLALVFCNTKRKCDSLVGEMQSRGYSADVLHGDLSQNIRDKVMDKFRKGRIEILIATDVAARGLDVDDISVVFNYDIPHDPEYYVHRIGRTGRAGRKGFAYTFSSAGRKTKNIRYIENQIRAQIRTIPMPSLSEVKESKMGVFVDKLKKVLNGGGLRPYIEQIEGIATDDFTPIEVAAALLKMSSGTENEFSESGQQEVQQRPATPSGRSSSGKRSHKSRNGSGASRKKENEPFYAEYVNGNRRKRKKSGKRSKKG
ncbi:MAG: DEAD/DEAH box helicase [Balneolaceae bacterium]